MMRPFKTHADRTAKFWSLVALLHVLSAAGLHAQSGPSSVASGASSRAHEYSALLAGRQIIEEFGGPSVDMLAQSITALIIADPEAHRVRNSSRELVREQVEDDLRKVVADRLSIAHESFRLADFGVDRNRFTQWMLEELADVVEARRKEVVGERLDPAFERGRSQAVAQQIARLHSDVYPTQAEVDALDSQDWAVSAREALEKKVADRIGSRIPTLLEEAQIKAEQLATEAVSEAFTQRAAQFESLDLATVPESLAAREAIEPTLVNAVTATIKALRETRKQAGDTRVVYDPVPSIQNRARSRSAQVERDRWKKYVGEFRSIRTSNELEPAIRADLRTHKLLSTSRRVLVRSTYEEFKVQAINGYASRGGDELPAHDFSKRLARFLEEDDGIKEAAQQAAALSLEPGLPEARRRIADDQMRQHFPTIIDGGWRVPDTDLGVSLATGALSVSNIDEAFSLPDIDQQGENYDRQLLLEETENELLRGVGMLISEADRAYRAQQKLYELEQKIIDAELFPDGAAPKGTTVDEMTNRYLGRIHEDWSGRRGREVFSGSGRADEYNTWVRKYVYFFPPIRVAIGEHVKAFFEVAGDNKEDETIVRVEPIVTEDPVVRPPKPEQSGPGGPEIGGVGDDGGGSGGDGGGGSGGAPVELCWELGTGSTGTSLEFKVENLSLVMDMLSERLQPALSPVISDQEYGGRVARYQIGPIELVLRGKSE